MSKNVSTIYSYLDSENVKHSNLGYKYLFDMIAMIVESPERFDKISDAYDLVAEKHSTRSSCVERAIRHTIIQKNTTNKEFILKATHDILYNNKESAQSN